MPEGRGMTTYINARTARTWVFVFFFYMGRFRWFRWLVALVVIVGVIVVIALFLHNVTKDNPDLGGKPQPLTLRMNAE
jgi:hypothetical protein